MYTYVLVCFVICSMNHYVGIRVIGLEYIGSESVPITVYYDRRVSIVICEFESVSPGDILICNINNAGYNSYKRRAFFIVGDCYGAIRTDCSTQLIGEIGACDEMVIRSYIDMDNAYCDADVLDAQFGSDNAFTNSKNTINGIRTLTFTELDPYIQWILICLLIAFIALVIVAIYICFVRNRIYKSDTENLEKDIDRDVIAHTIAMNHVSSISQHKPIEIPLKTGNGNITEETDSTLTQSDQHEQEQHPSVSPSDGDDMKMTSPKSDHEEAEMLSPKSAEVG